MFTIKAFRCNGAGHQVTHIYEAEKVTLRGHEMGLCNPGEICVVLDHSNGGHTAVTVTSEQPKSPDHKPCHKLIIQNSDGRTIETITPKG